VLRERASGNVICDTPLPVKHPALFDFNAPIFLQQKRAR